MNAFDVFVRLPNGKPQWLESLEDIATAEQHAIRFSNLFKAEAFIFSEKEGMVIKRVDARRHGRAA
jgi:hypothetical protein